MLDVETVRKDFSILREEVHGHQLVYLDNAATTQVPTSVIEVVSSHYQTANANVHRAVHSMASKSTRAFEDARSNVARFVNAESSDSVVFAKGTTDAINIVARGLRDYVKEGDVILPTIMEHHANYVPWQQLARERGARFEVVDITEDGEIDLADYAEKLRMKPKVVALAYCSNVLGTLNPVKELTRLAHDAGALVLVDGAQAMRHGIIDLADLDCDYFAFSGHKMMAGTGIGCLCGKPQALELLKPSEFGGEMVDEVSIGSTTFEKLPIRLEAGTPNYVGAIALSAAIDYLDGIGIDEISQYEDMLLKRAEMSLLRIEGIKILGQAQTRKGCISFNIEGVHPFDLCSMLDLRGIALRSGTSCAQPLMQRLSIAGAARLSPAFYNTIEEIDFAIEQIEEMSQRLRSAG